MAVSISVNRPKLNPTNSYDISLATGSTAEVDSLSEESFYIPIRTGSIDPDSFTVASCTTTNNSTTVTTTSNGFLNVKVGDAVTGTGIAGGTTVSAKASNTSITLSANATASGTVTLTFDPPSLQATLVAVKVKMVKSGDAQKLTPSVTLYVYDGSLGSTAGTDSNATASYTLVPQEGASPVLDVNAFLNKIRVFQTNT